MCGENHLVECFNAAIGHLQLNPQRVAPDLGHRARQANVNIGPRQGALKAAHIFARAAAHRAPLMLTTSAEKGVVFHETNHCLRRKIKDLRDGRGPNCAGEWGKVIITKPIAKLPFIDQFTDGNRGINQFAIGAFVEF